MRIRMAKDNVKGVTLVELIVTLAILSIVLVSVYSFFGFNLRIFNKSESLAQVQFDVRMTSEHIGTQIRTVTKLSFDELEGASIGSIGLIDLKIKYPLVHSIQMRVRKEGNGTFLEYIVIGRDSNGGNEYLIESEVLLVNKPELLIDEADLLNYMDIVFFDKNL